MQPAKQSEPTSRDDGWLVLEKHGWCDAAAQTLLPQPLTSGISSLIQFQRPSLGKKVGWKVSHYQAHQAGRQAGRQSKHAVVSTDAVAKSA
jgi:hypothetical protein